MSILAPCLIETNPKPPKNKQKPRRETNLDTRAEKPKKRAAPSKVPKKSTGQVIVQKTQDEADVCCGCDCEEHDPVATATVPTPSTVVSYSDFAISEECEWISDTIFDVANEFPDVLFQEGDIGTRRRESLNVKGVPQIHDDSSRMVGSRRPLTHRSSHGKKRLDIVYRSKWITNNFVVGDPLGAGMLLALKVPAPGFNPKHIAMELKVMRTISGGPNVVEFIAAYREMDRVFVVMNFFPHDDIFSLIHKIPLAETLEYMRNLFIALHHIHRYRVIHRDIKPANFLYNRAERRYLLVDFGLSHFVTSNHSRKRSADLSPSLKENVSSPFEPPAVSTFDIIVSVIFFLLSFFKF
ncbi:unnamed protein product [Nippostrongylus brasiliensis]|uniref:non-specific serine/threonine protein kinase n=1 Tax=Nippostrongylus brasiliensis TaxID=27835 RepID=A0A0N4YQA8_NIPBR|nr:unnamed protein product [Nippostrongylus brasiliensis]